MKLLLGQKSLGTFILAHIFLLVFLSANAQTLPSGFNLTTVGSGWVLPVGVAFNKTGQKLFVWEKAGKVFVSNWNASTLSYTKQTTPVIDISPEVGNFNDNGLLGFALDPNFDVNGYIYLLYVVDRHHLLYFGTSSYSATTNDYAKATIGRITRYKVTTNSSGQMIADPNSRFILLGESKSTGFPILLDSHGIGSLVFASDSTLLASCGDVASYASSDYGSNSYTYYQQALADGIIRPNENVGAFRAQMVNSLNGKIIRIDPATGNGIPSNPFYSSATPRSAASRVWTMGLRNPFRFSTKPNSGSTDRNMGHIGELFIGDVGFNNYEELTVIKSPASNCGWPIYEGINFDLAFKGIIVENKDEPNPLYGSGSCTQPYFTFQNLLKQATADNITTVYNPCSTTVSINTMHPNRSFHRVPILDWQHGSNLARVKYFSGNTLGTATIGTTQSGVIGVPFSGNSSSGGCWYTGTLFPSQYQNKFFLADYGANFIKVLTIENTDQLTQVDHFASGFQGIVHIEQNPLDGSIFCVEVTTATIRRIGFGGNKQPAAKIAADKQFGVSPFTVNFTGSGSNDPDGTIVSYLWDFGDGTPVTTGVNPTHVFSTSTGAPKKFVVKLTVKDDQNAVSTDSFIVSANNTPPRVSITSPQKNSVYTIGADTLYSMRADVTDAEHSSSKLFYQWQTSLRHNNHEHKEPIDTNKTTSANIIRIGCNGETYYWYFQLTVTDEAGLSTIDSAKIFPACSTAPPVVSAHPQSQTICSLQQVTFSSSVDDQAITGVQWQKSPKGGGAWTDIAGATTSTYSFSVSSADDSTRYRVAWTNSIGTTYTNAALLRVSITPPAPLGPTQQSFCFAATVGDLYPVGPAIKWYSVASSERSLSASTQLLSDNHYFATQTVSGCESKDRLDVFVNISPSGFTNITLNGGSSTGSISSYQWSVVSGPNTPAIANANEAVATVSNLVKGVYVFNLSLNNGASTSKVLVNVNPSDSNLTVHAGFDRAITLPVSSIRLDGSASTGAALYNWSLISGPSIPLIESPSSMSTLVSGLKEGQYAFKLTVNNPVNSILTDTVLVTVNPSTTIGVAPSINAVNVQSATNSAVVNTLNGVPAGSVLLLTLAQKDNGISVFNANQSVQPPTGSAINDGAALSLGMKFRSSVDGYVTGIRFYKASNNTGTHTGELYTSSGIRLAQAVFVNESASGWQEVKLSSPVLIAKGQTYIVSYHSSAGYYSETVGYFSSPVATAPLEGLADGVDGPNGLYVYSSTPAFPVNTYVQTNYWVDIVFSHADPNITSSPALTWTKRAEAGVGTRANAEIYTAVYAAGGNVSVTSNWANGPLSSVLYSVSNADPVFPGASANASAQTSPSVSIQTNRSNSLLFASTGDLNAISGSSRSYRDAATESHYHYLSGGYTGYHYRKATTNTAIYTEGLSAPTGMLAGTALYELAGTIAASTAPVADAGYNQKLQVAIPPSGAASQSFCNSATVAELKATGTAIKWYDSSVGGNQLSSGTALVNGKNYYASQTINGCESAVRLNVQAVVYPPPAIPTIAKTNLCTGAVQLTTDAIGNKLWSTGDTSSSVIVKQSGNYSVTINPGTSCSSIGYAQVTTASVIYSASISQKQDVICYGEQTGSLAVAATGGATPYQYLWSNNSTASQISDLSAGAYQVAVSDNSGCIILLYDTIIQPLSAVSMNVSQTNIFVFGAATGSLQISASGGASPYTYSINGANYQSSGSFSSLPAGEYTVYVKDAFGCIRRQVVTLTQPSAALFVELGSSSPILCYGDSSGTIAVNGSGGMPPYDYKLNNGSYQRSSTFTKLPAGAYALIIRDSVSTTDTLSITLTQPSSLPSFSASKSDIQCASGTGGITLNASGGTGPYVYSMDGGGSYQASSTFSGLGTGSYSLRVRDQNSCLSAIQSATIAQSSTSVQLSGSLSSGSIGSYLWTLVSGPNVPVIQTPSSANTAVSGLVKGKYTFKLSVNGGSSISFVTVNVDATALFADAGYDRTIYLPTNSIKLDGNGSSGNSIRYGWSLVSGPNTPSFSGSTSAAPTVSGLVQGVYSFKLEVTDNANTVSRDTVSVTVSPAPIEGNRPVINTIDNKSSTSNTVTNSFANVPKGALLVLSLAQGGDISASNGANAVVTSSPTLVWTKRSDAGAIGSGNAEVYTAVFAAGGKISIKSTWGANAMSGTAYVITNYHTSIDGSSAAVNSQATPNVPISSTLSNSILIGVTSDKNARTGTTRKYLDTAAESQYYFRSGVFASYHYRKLTYAKSTYTEGLSAPTGMSAGTAFYEVKGTTFTATPVIAHAGYNQSIVCTGSNLLTRKYKIVTPASEGHLSKFKVMPNPGYGKYRLLYNGIQPGSVSLNVTDVQGRQILNQNLSVREPNGFIFLDLTEFPGGVYFIRLRHAKGVVTERAIRL